MTKSSLPSRTTRLQRLNTIADLDAATTWSILNVAEILESHRLAHGYLPPLLRGRCLAMVFDETSMRTRNAFERAMADLGGHAIHFTGQEARLGRHAQYEEHLEDFVQVIGRFNDVLLTRIYDHSVQERIAGLSPVPFINGMCDQHHPTQALCDFLTIRRRLRELQGLKVAFVGDGTNVARSLAQTAALLGVNLIMATPPSCALPPSVVDGLPGFSWTPDPNEAADKADVIVGDVWIPMNKRHEADHRRELLAPYRITERLMLLAKPHAFFLHNLPANRGDEVDVEVIDGPRSAVYEEAVSRLHIARSLLMHMLHPNPASAMAQSGITS
jgi:ornithine carbamoyltransferase